MSGTILQHLESGRAAQYVNSDSVLQQCILCRLDEAICLQTIKSGGFLKKQLPLKAGTVATIVHTLYPENNIKMCYSASFIN